MRLAAVLLLAACGTKAPLVAPDAPPDSVAIDPCDACTPDQLCVEDFDGTCGAASTCVARAATCHDPSLTEQACSQACNDAYCRAPLSCLDRLTCSNKPPSPKAFTCYGP